MPLVTGVQGNSVPALSFVESLSRVVAAKPVGVQAAAGLSTLARALIASGTIDAILKVTEAGTAEATPSRIPGHERFELEDPAVSNAVLLTREPKSVVPRLPASGLEAHSAEPEPKTPGSLAIADDKGAGEDLGTGKGSAAVASQGQIPAGSSKAMITNDAVATIVNAVIRKGEAEGTQTVAATPGGLGATAADDPAVLQKPATTAIQGQAPADLAIPEGAIASIVKAELGNSEAGGAQATVEEHEAPSETGASEAAVSPEQALPELMPTGGASHSPSAVLNQATPASATEQFSAAVVASATRAHDAGAPAAQADGPQGSITNEALARDHAEFPIPLNRRTAKTPSMRAAPPVEICFRCRKPRRNSRCACNMGFRFLPF